MRGLAWISVFGFVGLLLSFAFKIPHGLEIFHIFAAAGAMAGYAIGEYTVRSIKGKGMLAFLAFGSLVFLFVCGIAYSILIEENFSGTWIVVTLGVVLTVSFFCLTYLMALAGVVIEYPRAKNHTKDIN